MLDVSRTDKNIPEAGFASKKSCSRLDASQTSLEMGVEEGSCSGLKRIHGADMMVPDGKGKLSLWQNAFMFMFIFIFIFHFSFSSFIFHFSFSFIFIFILIVIHFIFMYLKYMCCMYTSGCRPCTCKSTIFLTQFPPNYNPVLIQLKSPTLVILD